MLDRLFAARRDRIVNAWIARVEASGGRGSAPDPAGGNDSPRTPPLKGVSFDDLNATIIRDAATAIYAALNGQSVAPDNPDDLILKTLASFAELQVVRDCDPLQATGCIYLFKPLLREHILPEALAKGALDAYLEAESRLDSLALLFFAAYTRCRERLYAARLDAMRREQFMVRRWAERHGLETES